MSENADRVPIDMPENLFGIGMSPESDHYVYVSFSAISLIGFFGEHEWAQVFSHTHKPQSTREHFCIYFVSHCVDFREVAVDEISTSINKVDQWGLCGGKNGTLLNTIFGTPQYQSHSPAWQDNILVYRQYRFCLVMENSISPGYITEKILNAFLGGCVPIYYGPEDVFDIFNHKPGPLLLSQCFQPNTCSGTEFDTLKEQKLPICRYLVMSPFWRTVTSRSKYSFIRRFYWQWHFEAKNSGYARFGLITQGMY
jgi:hypothetical protein